MIGGYQQDMVVRIACETVAALCWPRISTKSPTPCRKNACSSRSRSPPSPITVGRTDSPCFRQAANINGRRRMPFVTSCSPPTNSRRNGKSQAVPRRQLAIRRNYNAVGNGQDGFARQSSSSHILHLAADCHCHIPCRLVDLGMGIDALQIVVQDVAATISSGHRCRPRTRTAHLDHCSKRQHHTVRR